MNILILGAGEIGVLLASKLIESNHNITMIESDPILCKKANDILDANVIEGNAGNFELLKSANLSSIDVLAAVTNNDEVNILSSIIAKKMEVPTVIARVKKPEYAAKDFPLRDFSYGPDLIIQPEKETARAIVQLVKNTNATEYYEFEGGKVKIVGIRIDKHFAHSGIKLNQIGNIIKELPFIVLALIRAERTVIPKGSDFITLGDQIFFICESVNLSKVLEFFGKATIKNENVMIVGGALIGQYVAQGLESKFNVKIIENDYKKTKLLAKNLTKTLIINSDPTDLDVLEQENLSGMDEFITVTDSDETNIICSKLAHHNGVPRTITLIKKYDYLKMTSSIGLDSVVSKQVMTVSTIRQFIQRQKVASYTEILGLDATVLELETTTKSKIIRKPLMNLDFPDKSVVGAIIKPNGAVVIPSGLSKIDAKDKVVMFFSPEKQNEIERLF